LGDEIDFLGVSKLQFQDTREGGMLSPTNLHAFSRLRAMEICLVSGSDHSDPHRGSLREGSKSNGLFSAPEQRAGRAMELRARTFMESTWI